MTGKVKVTAQPTLIRLAIIAHTNAKAVPTNDTYYGCHIKAVELFNRSYGVHITSYHSTIIICLC